MSEPTMYETGLDAALRHYGLTGVHPALDLIPPMTDAERLALMDDATQHGWLVPVTATSDGILLDGRERLIASVRICKDVPIERLDPIDPIQFVLSRNLYRHHFSQRQQTQGRRAILRAQNERDDV